MNRITLAPTTLPSTPPLEFIRAADAAGFEGLGFRLHKLEEMKPSLDYAADLGATYALVIGRDSDRSHQRDSFAAFCNVAGAFGLTAAIEAPVGTLSPISAAFRVIQETGRANAVVCIGPTAFMRAGDTPESLAGVDPQLLPYTQINDGKREGGGRLRPGDGDARVDALLDALPTNIPLSLECPAPKDSSYTAEEWARFAMQGTRRFLNDYDAARAVATI